ncbi:helix-turn-helix domain-containing protein [Nocardia carnea]|uniref:helix-turn-helix domain-containing protein n=1 Tax=Nocardia carnea TaxID=37328 RepID=UPI0024563292|nr:helix-turn-helix domain-containing protein [Nocardia carnea]
MNSSDVARLVQEVLRTVTHGEPDVTALAGSLTELGLEAGASGDIVDRVRRDRAEVARLRRREQELTALFSSARDLAEVRDIDALLARLVARAHEMMGTDVTYLSEFDPTTRDLHVRKTMGAVTPQFRDLHVPAGTGLASRIADTRSAQWVPRYSEYVEGPHEHTIDDAVFAEGIVSILGVPMLSDGTVLGVLFAATRQEHRFTPEEIALLSALADHASVVLQTANILAQLRESQDRTRGALEKLTAHLEARDRSSAVHQELVHAVLSGGGFTQVARTLAAALDRRVTIVDAESFSIATSAAAGNEHVAVSLSPDVRAAISVSRSSGHCRTVENNRSVEAVAAVTAGELYFGALLLTPGSVELGPVERRTIERAAQVAALLALQQRAVTDAYRRERGELIADLLDSSPERRRDMDKRMRNHRLTSSDLRTLHIVEVPPDRRARAERAAAGFLGDSGLVGEYAATVAVIGSAADPIAFANDLRTHLIGALGAPVLLVTPPRAATPDELPRLFRTAQQTVRLLAGLGVDNGAVATDAYAPYTVLFGTNPEALHSFLDLTIGPVVDYDARHGTDLLATLRTFVRHEASPTKTARALNYHPNTILQRLDRLKALLGADWRQDEHLFRISLATRLDELRSVSRQ